MRRGYWKVALLICAALGASGSARALDSKPDEGLPWPFDSNEKVELAHGEYYTLVGTVELADGAAYLVVDFEEHPWLQSARRKKEPFYRLENGMVDWTEWEDRKVKLVARAKWKIARLAKDRYDCHVWLVAEDTPTPVGAK